MALRHVDAGHAAAALLDHLEDVKAGARAHHARSTPPSGSACGRLHEQRRIAVGACAGRPRRRWPPRPGASENSRASLAKSSPARARSSTRWALARRLATCASLAFSGTATRMWARLISIGAASLPPCCCSRRYWSTSRSRHLDARFELALAQPRAAAAGCAGPRGTAPARCRRRPAGGAAPATSIWFWRATFCSAWSTVASSTLMPVSRASCSCAFSLISRSSTWRANSGARRHRPGPAAPAAARSAPSASAPRCW